MATVTKTIQAGGDYTTIQGWIDDLDESSIYSSSDIAIGLVSGDHEISTKITMNTGDTIGLAQARISVAEADRHDGIEGTGVTLTVSTSTNYCFQSTTSAVRYTIEWLEWDYEDTNHGGDVWIAIGSGDSTITCAPTFGHNMIHSVDAGSEIGRIVQVGGWWSCVHNNILYDMTGTSTGYFHGLQGGGFDSRVSACSNNTVYNIHGGDNVAGIGNWSTSGSYMRVFNNISVGTTAEAGGSAVDFGMTWTGSTMGDNNLSSDTTASGPNAVESVSAASLFVSTSDPKDLHLKAGADAIGAGADLGTGITLLSGNSVGTSDVGTALNYDIDNYNRNDDANWDIGADQFVSAAVKIAKSFLLFLLDN